MNQIKNMKKEINLGDKFDVAVTVNGIRIEVAADGSVQAYTNGNVQILRPSNDDGQKSAGAAALEIGDMREDGTIYAGVSPDTGEALYVMPGDPYHTYTHALRWKEAMKYAEGYANCHKDWRLPTKAELDVLFKNRHKGALRDSFNESGYPGVGMYWSSTQEVRGDTDGAAAQRFSGGGYQAWLYKSDKASVRLVRSEPRPSV